MSPVAIIGAGITGLSAAFKLRQRGIPVMVYEGSGQVGGVIRTVRRHGWLAECGPNSILETSPQIPDLMRELGLISRRIYSAPRAEKRFLVRNGRLVQLPGSPQGILTTRLFSWWAKLRLFGEPFIRRAPAEVEESLAQFVMRRLGQEFLDYAVNPFVAGVYAGDPAKLSVKHAFPKLHALEQRYGSLILGQVLGARERRRRKEISKQGAKKFSFDDGLRVLTDALGLWLDDAIRLHTPIKRIARMNSGWRLLASHGCELATEHSAVLLAMPAYQLAKLEFTCSKRPEEALTSKSAIRNPQLNRASSRRRLRIPRRVHGLCQLWAIFTTRLSRAWCWVFSGRMSRIRSMASGCSFRKWNGSTCWEPYSVRRSFPIVRQQGMFC